MGHADARARSLSWPITPLPPTAVTSVALSITLLTALAVWPSPVPAHAVSPCVRFPAHALALRATAGNLVRENAAARRQGLSWLRDVAMVRRFTRSGLLAPVPARTGTYWVASMTPALRVVRPWTKRFIEQVSRAFRARFGAQLKLTSLTRPAVTQDALRRINGNAAPARGPLRSTHLTGAAVDISKHSFGEPHVRWFRVVLQRLAARGLLSAIEEFEQPHFHVLVFRALSDYPSARLSALLGSTC